MPIILQWIDFGHSPNVVTPSRSLPSSLKFGSISFITRSESNPPSVERSSSQISLCVLLIPSIAAADEFPATALSIAAWSAFDTPATADTMTLILSDEARPTMISVESSILLAFPIEVPPNLRVSMVFSWIFLSFSSSFFD